MSVLSGGTPDIRCVCQFLGSRPHIVRKLSRPEGGYGDDEPDADSQGELADDAEELACACADTSPQGEVGMLAAGDLNGPDGQSRAETGPDYGAHQRHGKHHRSDDRAEQRPKQSGN